MRLPFRRVIEGRVIPGFSQGRAEGSWKPRRSYGADKTIHQTGTIDIQLKPDGTVYAVWFRCLNLPFRVSQLTWDEIGPPGRYHDLNNDGLAIETITYVERYARPDEPDGSLPARPRGPGEATQVPAAPRVEGVAR